jgi:hypothetical protein
MIAFRFHFVLVFFNGGLVCHFQNYLSIENFGDPFLLVILGGETLASIKLRIQEKLQVTNEEFSKVSMLN